MTSIHPSEALYQGGKPPPFLPCCDHYAGTEKRILKALELQHQSGPEFDVTCDCEDGAPAGRETEHAEMVARILASPANRRRRAGARIHDFTHPHWRRDVEILVGGAGDALAYLTVPKATGVAPLAETIEYIRSVASRSGLAREIPIHVLIETHGALRDVQQIAALPGVEALAFGLLDFISDHYGAIPAGAMRSPGQFEHRLIARAKCEVVAAALGRGLVPAHNITLDLDDPRAAFEDARRARLEFGFLRMWSIHPRQIAPILEAMRPDDSEIEEAAAVLLAAQRADWGPIRYRGGLHDRASYRYHWNVLQRARSAGAAIPQAARQAFFGEGGKS